MVRIEDNDSPQEDSSGSQMNIEFNPIIELWPELTLEEKVDKAWRKISHEVPKKRNPLKATTHDFKLVCLFISVMIAIFKIFLGLTNIDNCPTNDWLPVYQYVGGLFELGFLLTLLFRKLRIITFFQVPLGLCMMVWFVIAAANTFIEWQPDYFKRGTRYCNYYFFNSSVAILFLQLVFNLLLMFYVSIKFSFYD